MDLKKMFELAKIPIAVIVAMGIVGIIGGYVPGLNCVTGLATRVVILGALGYAGYNAVKVGALDIKGAAIVGAIAGIVGAFINAVLSVVQILALGVPVSGIGEAGAIGETVAKDMIFMAALIGLIISPIIGAILGAILGAIGGYIAGTQGKPETQKKK